MPTAYVAALFDDKETQTLGWVETVTRPSLACHPRQSRFPFLPVTRSSQLLTVGIT